MERDDSITRDFSTTAPTLAITSKTDFSAKTGVEVAARNTSKENVPISVSFILSERVLRRQTRKEIFILKQINIQKKFSDVMCML